MAQETMLDSMITAPLPPATALPEWRRRVRVRHPFQCAAVVSTQQETTRCHDGILHDISVEGISFILKTSFPRDTVLGVELMSTTSPCKLVARVAHATAHGEDWLLGCELVRPLSVTELYGLIS
jgi:hypothetical protein